MKKTFTVLFAIGLVFALLACNTSVPGSSGGGPGGGTAKEIIIPADQLAAVYSLETSGNYPGTEINLTTAEMKAYMEQQGVSFVDFSKYQAISLDVELYTSYTDEDTNTLAVAATGEGAKGNLAQFRVLKHTSDWDKPNNYCHESAFYDLPIEGAKTWTIPAGSKGVPGAIVLFANWADHGSSSGQKVTHIKVKEIKFIPPGDVVILTVAYNKTGGKYVQVADTDTGTNKIIFTEARNDSGAALYKFTDSQLKGLANKTITVTYKVESITASSTNHEQQLVIQAAGDGPDDVYHAGHQQYPTLSPDGSGTLTLDVKTLMDGAAAATPKFTLTGFRFVNNGGTTNNDAGSATNGYTRDLTYNLIIEQVDAK